MRPILYITILATCGLAALSAAEQCRCKHPDREAIRERFDANGDGRLDEGERAAAVAAATERLKEKHPERFARVDKDGDGSLSQDERRAARKRLSERRCDRRDGGSDAEHQVRGERGDRGRRAHGDPADNGHDHGRRGRDGE